MRSPNVLKIFKLFGYSRNSSINVNAPNVFKIFEYPIASTQISNIMTPLIHSAPRFSTPPITISCVSLVSRRVKILSWIVEVVS